MILHAGLLAARVGGDWRGVLVDGPSGVGKSDLALRALAHGFQMVADDRVIAWVCDGRLFGAAPAPIQGLMEQRGLGVLPVPYRRLTEISLLAVCEPMDRAIERLPDPQARLVEGVSIPLLRLHPLEASAPFKLLRALSHIGAQP